MEIITELSHIPGLSVALGFFDGIHIGHQAVISCAVEYAKNNNCKSAIVTFKKHPSEILKGHPVGYIITKNEKYNLLENLGVDYVIELDFEQVQFMTPEKYLEEILVKYFSPVAISTGFNHTFGVNKQGNVSFLSDHQQVFNYIYFATPQQSLFGDMVSSSAIRSGIKSGDFFLVNSMLGRKYNISGEVVHGKHLGKKIGYPTINIEYPEGLIIPKLGVYDVNVKLETDEIYRGIANLGKKPTVSDNGDIGLEIYLFDFEGDLYGQRVNVEFSKFIRMERKFEGIEALKSQIKSDIKNLMNL